MCSGTFSRNSMSLSYSMKDPVGLLGFAMKINLVLSSIDSSIRSRS